MRRRARGSSRSPAASTRWCCAGRSRASGWLRAGRSRILSIMIAVDWGTSAFRAYRLDAQGRILDRRVAPRGILMVEAGGFATVLTEELRHWLDDEPGAVL